MMGCKKGDVGGWETFGNSFPQSSALVRIELPKRVVDIITCASNVHLYPRLEALTDFLHSGRDRVAAIQFHRGRKRRSGKSQARARFMSCPERLEPGGVKVQSFLSSDSDTYIHWPVVGVTNKYTRLVITVGLWSDIGVFGTRSQSNVLA
ncbi:hypothetical protein LY78DRAFT_42754 [Colletotrichum sublineola]|nr:hypothetical protein LY78DRAFT_42754 [Colletotrichum sublineola]